MMTGLFRKATLLSACGLLIAGVAVAGVADPGHSVIGSGITLVGTAGGAADPFQAHTITVKDALGNPVQNSTVTIDFSASAASDIRLCSTQPWTGVGVSCGNHQVVALTDVNGNVVFRVVGFAVNAGGATNPNPPAPGFGTGGALVKADGITLGTLTVSAVDQNGVAGLSSVDLALIANDFFAFGWSGSPPSSERGRSDLNASGTITSVDLATAATDFFTHNSNASCGAACP